MSSNYFQMESVEQYLLKFPSLPKFKRESFQCWESKVLRITSTNFTAVMVGIGLFINLAVAAAALASIPYWICFAVTLTLMEVFVVIEAFDQKQNEINLNFVMAQEKANQLQVAINQARQEYNNPIVIKEYRKNLITLKTLIAEYKFLPENLRQAKKTVKKDCYKASLDSFLGSLPIAEQQIPGIKEIDLQSLYAVGLIDMTDLNLKKDFGSFLQSHLSSLMKAKKSLIRKFHYEPNQIFLSYRLRDLEQQYHEKKHNCEKQINEIIDTTHQLIAAIKQNRRSLRNHIRELLTELKHCESQMIHLIDIKKSLNIFSKSK